jgi:hypothetical protein
MLRSLLFAMTLGLVSLNAQNTPTFLFPAGVTVQTATPQQLSDAFGTAIKSQPSQAASLFESALGAAGMRGLPDSQEVRNAVSAVTCALAASIPPETLPDALKPAFDIYPDSILTIVATLSAINSQKEGKSPTDTNPTPMNLGNVRVLKVEGGKVEFVDSKGAISNLKEGMFIQQGSKIVTGKNEAVDLVFENGSVLQIKPETEFYIDQFEQTPFEHQGFDYQRLAKEPSASQIKLTVAEGNIEVDVAKLKKESRYQVFTPLGSAGIRGTSFFISSQKKNPNAPVAIGVAEGLVQFTTTAGDSRSVSTGQVFGLTPMPSGILFTPNPQGFSNLLSMTFQTAAQLRRTTPATPFLAVPAPIPAPPAPLSMLPTGHSALLLQAELLGNPILLQVAQKLVQTTPQFAPQISAAVANLSPNIAVQIAVDMARFLPVQVPLIAAYVSSAAPYQAPAIAAALAGLMPGQTLALAVAVSQVVPSRAASVASAIARVAPDQAASIAVVIATTIPNQTMPIAQNVSLTVPSQGDAIIAALSAGSGNPGISSTQSGALQNQNPGSLSQPSPTPTPVPTPAASPSQPLKVTPVSPSA